MPRISIPSAYASALTGSSSPAIATSITALSSFALVPKTSSTVGSATPDYGGRRVVETLIGSAIAVLAVLVSPPAPAPERVISDVLTPLRRCRDALTEIGSAISSVWTLEQAQAWRREALGLVEATATARRDH